MGFRSATTFASVLALAGLASCADDPAAAVGASQDLTELTVEQLTAQLQELRVARYEHDRRYMGWAHADNNCFIRMRAAYYYLNFGELPQYDETETEQQYEMIDRISSLEESYVDEIAFSVAGSLSLEGSFVTDDAESTDRVTGSYRVTWTNHHAAIAQTSEGPRVIDLAVADVPLTPEQWSATFLPSSLQGRCAHDDPDATQRILSYQIQKSLRQDPPPPDPPCSFEQHAIFVDDDGTPYSSDELYPYMWNDVHEMAVSTDYVAHNAGDAMYLMTHPDKVPLVRMNTTSIDYQP